MPLALARSIEGGGGYDPRRAREAYEAWGASRPFDCGLTVHAALQGQPNEGSQANGSLMRASPLGVFAHRLPPPWAAALARLDSALTHPHQVCGDSVAAFVVAVSHAIDQGGGAEAAYAAAVQWAKEAPAASAVAEVLEAAAHAAPRCDGSSQGWVLIALQNASSAPRARSRWSRADDPSRRRHRHQRRHRGACWAVHGRGLPRSGAR